MDDCAATPTCSIGRAMEILGERWTFLILHEAFHGVRRLSEMQRNLGIARNILSARLQLLVRTRHPRAAPLPGRARALRVPADRDRSRLSIQPSSRSRGGATSTSCDDGAPVVLRHRCGHAADPGAACARTAAKSSTRAT